MRMDREVAANLNRALRENGEFTFSSREELITLTANFLASEYHRHLEFWRCTAMDDREETAYWDRRIEHEVEPYCDALKKGLEAETKKKWFGLAKNEIRISHRHKKILEGALRAIGKSGVNISGVAANVTYVLNLRENKLQKIIKPC